MRRTAVVGIGAAGAGLLALALLAGPFGGAPPRVTPLDESEADPGGRGPRAPATAPAPRAAATGDDTTPESNPGGADGEPTVDGPAIRGTVVDAVSGDPIEGATVEVRPTTGETLTPTRPERRGLVGFEAWLFRATGRSQSSPTGRFALPWSASGAADVRVEAPGHLEELRLTVSVDDELRIALRPGVGIRGRVHRRDGVGIEGALVRAATSPREGPRRDVAYSTTHSGADGTFEVQGLADAMSSIVVDHPAFMPASAQVAPGSPPFDIALPGALRATFRVRAPDGGALAAPIVQWSRTGADGRPIQMGVEDLGLGTGDVGDEGQAGAFTEWGPVRVPSEPADGTVRFVVSAPGRLPWTSDPISMPAGGAQRTLDVALERDPAAGSLTVRVLDPDSHEVAAPSDDLLVSVRRTDGPARAPRGRALAGALAFDGLPAGSYEVFATHRRFGAATVMATIEGGREARVEVRLTAPASLRVKIDAGGRRRVQFQVLRDGSAVPAFEEATPGAAGRPSTPEASRLHFLAGPDGTTLHGLAAGRYTVRVVSPDLVATDAEVEVGAGGATEIVVRATPR